MTANEKAIPKGVRILRDRDGHVVLDLPVTQDSVLKYTMVIFGFVFVMGGLFMYFDENGDMRALYPLIIGALMICGGLYLILGRIEWRLGTDSLAYTRIFFHRWKTRVVSKADIMAVQTEVAVRTNKKPTSWYVSLLVSQVAELKVGADQQPQAMKTVILPGQFKQPTLSWFQNLISQWVSG